MTPAGIKVAAALSIVNGAGFGAPIPWAMWRLRRDDHVPMLLGFPTYGGGPFERWGIRTSQWLLLAFLVVNILEGVAGVLLWTGARSGAILGFAVLPFAALFWIGFALPFGPPLAIASTILVIIDWARLNKQHEQLTLASFTL